MRITDTENKKPFLSKPAAACLVATLCCLLWGSAFPFVKTGYALMNISANDSASALLFGGIRFTVAGAIIILFASIKYRRFEAPKSKGSFYRVILISLFQTVGQYFFYYIGIAHTSGVKASVIVGTNVFSVLIMSCLVFRIEKSTLQKLIGCVIGFSGVLIINMSKGGFDKNISLLGEGFMLISTIVYAVSPVLMKKYSEKDDVMMLSGWQFFMGGLALSAVGLAFGGKIHFDGVASVMVLIYLALVSAVAYTLWAALLKVNSVSTITVYGFMNPIFGVLLSAMILGESAEAFKLKNLLSLILVCIGIFIVNKQPTRKKLSDKDI